MDVAVTKFMTSAVAGMENQAPGRPPEEDAAGTGTRVLADCFDLLRLLGLCRKDACVLLLDEDFRVLGAHPVDNARVDDPQVEGTVGKRFDVLYKQGIMPHRITKFIKGLSEGLKVYLYFYHEPGEEGVPGYYLCSITEREEDDVLSVYLASTARNIRYIARVVNRYVGGSGGRLDDRPAEPANSGFISQKEQIALNKRAIVETLKSTGGNKRRAAHILGISRQTIYRLLRD